MRKFKKNATVAFLAVSMLLCAGCGNSNNTVTDEEATAGEASTATDSDTEKDESSSPVMAEPSSPEALAEQENFSAYLYDSFKESVTSDTITLHYNVAHPENYDITMDEVTYGDTDISEEANAENVEELNNELDELEDFNYDFLTSEQQFTYDILHDVLETNIESYDFNYMYEPFSYTSGLQSNLPITLAEYTFYDSDDVDDYLELLTLTPEYVQSWLDYEQEKIERDLFMNSNSANEVIRQCSEYIASPEENLLIETFNDSIEEVDGLTDEQIETYKQTNHDAVINYIIPAYENIISFFTANKNEGKNELGLVYYDNGKEYYEYLLKSDVGTDKTPDEIIELLENRIDEVMSEYYSVAMSNYDAYTQYFDDSENIYGDIDPKETIEYFETAMSDRFPDIPDIDFTVEKVHESLEDIVSPAFYMTPPLDGYESNSIYTNLDSDGAGSIWSTLAHEGVPGHMYQFVYFLSHNPEPIRVVLNFSGYQEGWATYVEQMAFDYYDDYEYDIYGDLERINSELSLLISARVEIGVNYEGWTLDETSDYLTENGFNGDAAGDIMDYVIAEPVNYQMYVTGWLEFEELRSLAQDELGDDFDESEFHEVILDAGPCQFYLLRERVEDYIAMN